MFVMKGVYTRNTVFWMTIDFVILHPLLPLIGKPWECRFPSFKGGVRSVDRADSRSEVGVFLGTPG